MLSRHAPQAILPGSVGVRPEATKSGTEPATPSRERALARVAKRHHGVVSLAQLNQLGLSASAVRSRVAQGRLHRVHQGVYAVGHPLLGLQGRFMAAVLACGPGAVLSHRSAAELWGVHSSARAAIDVTTPCRAGRSRPGIDAHWGRTLTAADVTVLNGIPCTTLARTLVDLAEAMPRRAVERALDQAEVERLLDARPLEDVLTRAAGRRGAAVVRAVLAEHRPGQTLTRNELEERFLALCAAAGIPRPAVNAWLVVGGGTFQVDFLWRAERLIVEADGGAAHRTRRAFEQDRRRDRLLLVAGWAVVRCTWRDVTRGPEELAGSVRRLLGSRRPAAQAATGSGDPGPATGGPQHNEPGSLPPGVSQLPPSVREAEKAGFPAPPTRS